MKRAMRLRFFASLCVFELQFGLSALGNPTLTAAIQTSESWADHMIAVVR